MELLTTLLAFLIAISVLIAVHEWGHFWVARRCGVKVLRFSIGFGKTLLRWQDKKGTEFVIALIPLGGYVKMLDTREAPVPAHLNQEAFNHKAVWQRALVIVAGPMANFGFAAVAFAVMYMVGIQGITPIIDGVLPGTPAAQANFVTPCLITEVNRKPIETINDLTPLLLTSAGSESPITLKTESLEPNAFPTESILDLSEWQAQSPGQLYSSLGIVFRGSGFNAPVVIGYVAEGSAAEEAGLKVGDKITAINETSVSYWQVFQKIIRNSPESDLTLSIQRNGSPLELSAMPDRVVTKSGDSIGSLGVALDPRVAPRPVIITQQFGPLKSLGKGVAKTVEVSKTSLILLGKMVLGQVATENLSGPVAIAQTAGVTAAIGIEYYLSFLAMVSVSLALINLFPIPVLDGGHLLFLLYEGIVRKPVPEKAQALATQLGLLVIFAIMSFALFNDITRLIG